MAWASAGASLNRMKFMGALGILRCGLGVGRDRRGTGDTELGSALGI